MFVTFRDFHRKREKIYFFFLIVFIKQKMKKHSDFIAKTVRAVLNEIRKFQILSFFIIFLHFLIVQLTPNLGTQIFSGHFETTILHHFCRTSRKTTCVFQHEKDARRNSVKVAPI